MPEQVLQPGTPTTPAITVKVPDAPSVAGVNGVAVLGVAPLPPIVLTPDPSALSQVLARVIAAGVTGAAIFVQRRTGIVVDQPVQTTIALGAYGIVHKLLSSLFARFSGRKFTFGF